MTKRQHWACDVCKCTGWVDMPAESQPDAVLLAIHTGHAEASPKCENDALWLQWPLTNGGLFKDRLKAGLLTNLAKTKRERYMICSDGMAETPANGWLDFEMDFEDAAKKHKAKGWTVIPKGVDYKPAPNFWQPIETAPKDGREVLLLSVSAWVGHFDVRAGKWRIDGAYIHPTHWAELPTMPPGCEDTK